MEALNNYGALFLQLPAWAEENHDKLIRTSGLYSLSFENRDSEYEPLVTSTTAQQSVTFMLTQV
jgi:hypothetical protein